MYAVNIASCLRTQVRSDRHLSRHASRTLTEQICPGMNANEIQIPHDKHHKVSSLVKSHQNTHNSVKYEVL